jgi:acyl transferase domain-containing protein
MILSPDGRCRAFDAQAQGTVIGSGLGIVVLKLLADALADGDHIYAVVKGSTINNDGALKAGYTAPALDAQAAVILEAQSVAGVPADTISYVEAHGTGTAVGDPIEIAALSKAFQFTTDQKQFCAIGSVKTNIGHLDAAAGVAGLIKTILALQHKEIPPSLNFQAANPRINFAETPFYVNIALRPWPGHAGPRRAGVSFFGIGGSNAHLVLEEAPALAPTPDTAQPWQLLPLSARTNTALEKATENLGLYLEQHPDDGLADIAYTLQVGRQEFKQRRFVVCRTLAEAKATLTTANSPHLFTAVSHATERPVAFMFAGQGALAQTAITQPALFVIEYALAQLWLSWGIRPQALIGHSIGEYVAACLAGVFSLADALMLVAARGRLMQALPAGAMLSVPLPETALASTEPLIC